MNKIFHLAIIPDGNRRYSAKHNIPLEKVYETSIDKLLQIAEWCRKENIKILTVYGFSLENWRRSISERKLLFGIFKKKSENFLNKKQKKEIKIKFIGQIYRFPKSLRYLLQRVEKETEKCGDFELNVLLNYTGKKEILSAVNRILKEKKTKISEEEFKNYLWLKKEPDLIIRTSGEMRLSGFLPFQSVNSRLHFEKKLFPEFEKEDFLRIVRNLQRKPETQN